MGDEECLCFHVRVVRFTVSSPMSGSRVGADCSRGVFEIGDDIDHQLAYLLFIATLDA